MAPGVLDADAAHSDDSRNRKHLIGIGQPRLDHRGGGDDLVDRPRLERRGHRQIADLPIALAADVLGRVEGVVVRHRQHLTGLGIQHDRGGVAGTGGVLGHLHLLLDVELDVIVESQLHGRAVLSLVAVAVAARDHHPVGTAVVGDRAVGAGQHRIHRVLQAQQSVAVPVDATDHVGRQRTTGILAQVLALGADLGELRRDRLGDSWIHRAGQVDEGLVTAQFLEHGGEVGTVVQPGRDVLGDLDQPLVRIGRLRRLLLGLSELLTHLGGLEGQGARFDGERQLVEVAVDDTAPYRLVHIDDLELSGGLGAQCLSFGYLQVEELGCRHDEGDEDDDVADAVPVDE